MLAQAAVSLGVRVRVLDPTEPRCPAAASAEQVVGSFTDPEAVAELAAVCSVDTCGPCVVTVEIEHVDTEALEAVSALGVDVQPLPATLCVIQDKLEQKRHFRAQGVPTPDFQPVGDPEQLEAALAEFGFPLVLKARRLAYDGRGNAVIKSTGEVEEAVASLGGYERGLYAERWVPFQKELAVMVARCKNGETRAFPLVETFHRDSILHVTEAPADVPPWTAKEAQQVALQTVEALEGAGIFGVEMFVDDEGHVLLNEVAPRPHNSGHYSIEACHTSQFEQHLRCVLGWPLGDPTLKVGASVMLNVLGEGEGEEGLAAAEALLSRALQVPGASVHWYGKEEVKAQRKVGHVTICAEDLPAAELKAKEACLDSDPHFWMPLTLKRSDYLQVMEKKGTDAAESGAHFDRMAAFRKKLLPAGGAVLGCVDIGSSAYWWDYGRLELYMDNNLLLTIPQHISEKHKNIQSQTNN